MLYESNEYALTPQDLAEPVTFMSGAHELFLEFHPRHFGKGVNSDGQPAQYPSVRFRDGAYLCVNSEELARLRAHAQCGKLFWDATAEAADLEASAWSAKEIAATAPLRPTAEDQADIEFLRANQVPNIKRLPQIIEVLGRVFKRWKVCGVRKPGADSKPIVVAAAVTQTYDAILGTGVVGPSGRLLELEAAAEDSAGEAFEETEGLAA